MDDTDKCERFKIYSFWGQNRQASEVNGTKLAGGFYKNMSTGPSNKKLNSYDIIAQVLSGVIILGVLFIFVSECKNARV